MVLITASMAPSPDPVLRLDPLRAPRAPAPPPLVTPTPVIFCIMTLKQMEGSMKTRHAFAQLSVMFPVPAQYIRVG
jgi:hypothetical protein